MPIEAQLADGRILEFPDGTDQSVIQSTVKRLISEQGAPAPAPVSVPAPAPFSTAPLTQPVAQPKPYVDRREALDDAVNLLEEGYSKEQVTDMFKGLGVPWSEITAHGQKRGSAFFQQQEVAPPTTPRTAQARPQGRIAAREPGMLEGVGNLFKRVDTNFGDMATSFLLQSGGFDPEQAAGQISQNARRRAAAAPDSSTQRGMEAIGGAKTYGQAAEAMLKNPAATFTMLAESVLTTIPGLAVTAATAGAGAGARAATTFASSGGVEYASVMTDVLQSNGVDLTNAAKVADALRNPKILAEMKEKGAKRGLIVGAFDALTMGMAGRFMRPATELVAAGKLQGAAAKKATVAAWAKELGVQAGGGAGGEFAAQKATGEDKPADVLLEALGETVSGPVDVYSSLKDVGRAEAAAKVAPRIEPTFDQAAPLTPAPTAAPAPAPAAAPAPVVGDEAKAARIEALTQQAIDVGIPEDDARLRAESIVAAEEAKALEALAPRIDAATQEFIDAGLAPEEARQRAIEQVKQEVADDALAESEAARDGSPAATQPGAGGAGVEVAGRPDTDTAATGTELSELAGVAPAGTPAGESDGREGAVSAPLTKEEVDVHPAVQLARQKAAEAEALRSGATDLNAERVKREAAAQTVQSDLEQLQQLAAQDRVPLDEVQDLTQRLQSGEDPASVARDVARLVSEATKRQSPDIQTAEVGEQQVGEAAPSEPLGVGETPKPKRGRPVTLTPEEKAAKEKERGAQRAVTMKADRAIKRITKTLDELSQPLDLEAIESDEALQAAEADRRSQKREAIKELLALQAAPNLRGTKVGQRVKDALAHKSITPKELADIKAGIEAQKRAQQALAAEGASSSGVREGHGKVDPAFGKFTTASQAISHIIKNGNRVQREFAKRLRGFVNGVKFVVLEEGQALPEQLQRHAAQWERSVGLFIENYKTGERAIYIRGASFGKNQGVNVVTVLHELLHAATNRKIAIAEDMVKSGKITDSKLLDAYKLLRANMQKAQDEFADLLTTGSVSRNVADLYASTNGEILGDPREFVAYGLTDESFQDFLASTEGLADDPDLFSGFVRTIRKFFGFPLSETNALTDLILATDALLSARTPSRYQMEETADEDASSAVKKGVASQKEVERAFKIAQEKFSESSKGEKYAEGISALQMIQNPRLVGQFLTNQWNTFSEGARKAMAFALPTDFLADAFGKAVPELKNTDMLMQRMGGMVQNLLGSAGKLTEEIDRAYRKDPSLQSKLDKVTHIATLMEVDPSNPNAPKRSIQLDRLWDDLGADGKRLYKRIQNHFEILSDYFKQLLDAQITQSGLPLAERANLLAKIRALYETESKIDPFFPLVRRGDYWLGIGSGQTRKFFMFETLAERNDAMRGFANERVKQKPGESDAAFAQRQKDTLQDLLETQEYTFGNDISTLRQMSANSSEMLKGIFEAIDASDLGDADVKDQLKDSVYQIYLQTMPEQSFRRQFIHRKEGGITGFRTDILRNTADASSRMAIQLARLKYGRLLRNSLSQARDSIVNRPQYEPVVAAFERRVQKELNPAPESVAEKVAGGLNKAAFVWYLGGISSALLQPLSIFQTGMPVLARYGVVNSHREMLKMLKVWSQYGVYRKNADGSTSWVMPTVEHAKGLTPEERRAVRAMSDFNLTASTYAGDVFDYKNTPSGNYSHPITQFGKDTVDALVLGGLMHATERISREVMFLTSFRLNRQAGKSFDEAINQAVVDTKEALGNYGEYNRPEFMRGAAGKVLTQFMMYPVHVSLFLLRNFAEMIKPMNGRTRAEAMKKFFGTMGTSFILAGSVGLPMFSTVMGLLGWAWEQLGGDDEEKPEELRNMSFELWFRTVWLQEQLGETLIAGKKLSDIVERGVANAITGLDISSRTSMNNLWTRDTKEYATIRENAMAMAMEKAGPAANMLLSWAEGYEAFMNGDYAKGLKKLTPAGFRNFVNAHEQWTEGSKDNKGAQILSKDAFTTGELIGQAVGFRSDLLANTQYVTFKVIGIEQKIINERTKLLQQLDREYRQKDVKAFTKYFKQMQEFNVKYPTYAIKDEDFVRSMESKAEARATSYRGVTLTEKNIGPLGKALVPSRKAATEREREGRE